MPGFQLRTPRGNNAALTGPASAFESETLGVIYDTTPYSEHAILHGVAIMIIIALALMSVVKLDRVVTATGRIVPTEGSLFVQPLDRSIVREIKVSVGDVVKQGQVLAMLDPTFAAADLTQLQQKMASASAVVARLDAERAGETYSAGTDSSQELQASIYRQRQSEYRQSLADFDARIHSTEAKITQARGDIANYEKRQQLASSVETMSQSLEANGVGSKLKTIMAIDSRVDIDRLLADSRNQLTQGQHDLDSLKAQREVFVVKWQDDIGNQLVAARNDLDQSQQGLAKAQRVDQLINIVAPRDAVVLQVGKASAGSVIDPTLGQDTQPLFTLVPLGAALEADVEIDNQDVGFVKVNDPVEIKLDAYAFIQHGTAEGRIKTISEGSFTQGENQEARSPFFKARIAISDVHLHDVPADFRLIPGMSLTADVKVGKRTIMSYLVNGALRTGSEAMREP